MIGAKETKKEREFSAYVLHALLGRCAEALDACQEIMERLDPALLTQTDTERLVKSIDHIIDEINRAIGK
jgi:hypothetical protein